MPASPARLNIKRNIPLDGNPSDPQRIEACISGRETEEEATRRMAYGDPIGSTYATLYLNGQVVNTDRELMCSKCGQWKVDSAFAKDRRLEGITRRGRAYYCKHCKATHYRGH